MLCLSITVRRSVEMHFMVSDLISMAVVKSCSEKTLPVQVFALNDSLLGEITPNEYPLKNGVEWIY